MDNREILRRKLEYATPQELLFILLNDTNQKFKKVIELWKEDKVEGTILARRVTDNIITLRQTLNTEIGNDESIKDALRTIGSLYDFMIEEITKCCFTRDYAQLEKVYGVFLNVKEIFDTDRKNMEKA